MQSVAAYTIAGNRIVDTVNVFKSRLKLLNRIEVDYDLSMIDENVEREEGLIYYDEKRKAIYIPVVNNAGKLTNKNLVYQLKGRYFEYIGTETKKRK